MSTIYISEQGAYLRKSAGTYSVQVKNEEIFAIPENVVERFVILGNVQISTQVINDVLENGIEMLFMSRNGKFKGMLTPGYPKNVFVRLAQYDSALDKKNMVEIAKDIVFRKITSEIQTLLKWKKNGWLAESNVGSTIKPILKVLEKKNEIRDIMSVEALASKKYFEKFSHCVPAPFSWNGRNRHPPLDPVNALLSLTYMMALGEIVAACYAHGIDPFIGFLHHLDYSRPSFALDLLELLRAPYCDHFVLKLLQSETFSPDDFQFSATNGCRLKSSPFKKYISLFADKMDENITNTPPLRCYIESIVKKSVQIFKNNAPKKGENLG